MPEPEFRLAVSLEASLALSEDPAKVKVAMANALGDARYSLQKGERLLRMTSDDPRSIKRLHDQLRDRHVRAAARNLLYHGREGRRTTVMLNRQAANAGVLVLCGTAGESPMGPMFFAIESKELDSVIQWPTSYETG
jgi:predicted RNA binding protein with dsRBD fold (UPF0201 family)